MQAKGDIVPNGKMRKQSVTLKNHGDIALAGSNVINDLPVHFQLAAGDLFQPGDHPQSCSFAAAGRAKQDEALAFPDLEVQRFDDFCFAVGFTDIFKYDTVHNLSFDPRLHKGIEYKFLADKIQSQRR